MTLLPTVSLLARLTEAAEAICHPADDRSAARFSRFFRITEEARSYLDNSVKPHFEIDADHLDRQRAFSLDTFGPGSRLFGVIDHIRKELDEVLAAPHDASEWADIVILAFDGGLRQGIAPQVLLDAVLAKQEKNEARTWPDWRGFGTDEAIEHDRSVDV